MQFAKVVDCLRQIHPHATNNEHSSLSIAPLKSVQTNL
jgi:hypothetical protein